MITRRVTTKVGNEMFNKLIKSCRKKNRNSVSLALFVGCQTLPSIQYESKRFYLSLENHVLNSTAMSNCKIMDHQLNMGYCQQSLPLEEVELQ